MKKSKSKEVLAQLEKCDEAALCTPPSPWPPRQLDVDGGWAWVVLVASFLAFAIMSSLFYTFGVYFSVFLEEFHESRSYTAWIGSLNAAFLQLGGPVASLVIVKLGCRISIQIGGIICTVGYVLSAYAQSVAQLFCTYGLILATGTCLVYTGLVVALGLYFQQRHPLAVGLSMAGSGVGVLVLGPAILYFLDEYGWRGSLLIDAGLTLQYVVLGSLVFPQRTSSSRLRRSDDSTLRVMGSQILEPTTEPVLDKSLLRDAKFWCLNMSGFFWVMAGLTVFVICKDYAESRQLGDEFTLALVGLGLGDVIGRVLGGVIASSPRVSTIFYYSLIMVACSVVILAHLVVCSALTLFVVSALFGFSYGQQSVLLPIAPMALYGPNKLALTFGYLLFTAGVGTLIGPPVAGWIVDETLSYEWAYIFAGISNFLAAICMFIVYVIDRNHRMSLHKSMILSADNPVNDQKLVVCLKPDIISDCCDDDQLTDVVPVTT